MKFFYCSGKKYLTLENRFLPFDPLLPYNLGGGGGLYFKKKCLLCSDASILLFLDNYH